MTMTPYNDEFHMHACFELAEKGLGNVSPNPLVGCVIVHNGEIIGQGFHQKYGEAHAEVNAIASVENKNLLPESTLYVNLEPCSHYGKTPPCADLLIKHQVKKVVICNIDSNPKVGGDGIKKLENAGIEVITGILEQEGRFLNRRFFTYIEKNRPYVILKWAQTLDGFMDVERRENEKINYWITNPKSRNLVHEWRTQEDAILVGANTVLNDNPQLNVRFAEGKNPVRIVFDPQKQIQDKNLHIFDESQKTIIYTDELQNGGLPFVMQDLRERKIQSVIVEGGKFTLESFIHAGLWDEMRIFTGNKKFGKGLTSPVIPDIEPNNIFQIDDDVLKTYYCEA